AVRGEDEGGRHVLLAVRRSIAGAPRARGLAPPSNLAGALRHVGLHPSPKAVELGLMVELNRDHHAVGHALGAGIVVQDVLDVRFVGAGPVEVDRPRAAGVEERRPRRGKLLIALRLGLTRDGDEEIGVACKRLAVARAAASCTAGRTTRAGAARNSATGDASRSPRLG